MCLVLLVWQPFLDASAQRSGKWKQTHDFRRIQNKGVREKNFVGDKRLRYFKISVWKDVIFCAVLISVFLITAVLPL